VGVRRRALRRVTLSTKEAVRAFLGALRGVPSIGGPYEEEVAALVAALEVRQLAASDFQLPASNL
jgi:hypothetical protein